MEYLDQKSIMSPSSSPEEETSSSPEVEEHMSSRPISPTTATPEPSTSPQDKLPSPPPTLPEDHQPSPRPTLAHVLLKHLMGLICLSIHQFTIANIVVADSRHLLRISV